MVGPGGGTQRDPAAGMGLHRGVLRVGQDAPGSAQQDARGGAGQGHAGTKAHSETTPMTPRPDLRAQGCLKGLGMGAHGEAPQLGWG